MPLLELGNRRSPNIFKVSYRSAVNGRVARAYVKVPYSGLYGLTETLTRQQAAGQILWFRVAIARPHEIAEHRSELARWLDALRATTRITKVDWAS